MIIFFYFSCYEEEAVIGITLRVYKYENCFYLSNDNAFHIETGNNVTVVWFEGFPN